MKNNVNKKINIKNAIIKKKINVEHAINDNVRKYLKYEY